MQVRNRHLHATTIYTERKQVIESGDFRWEKVYSFHFTITLTTILTPQTFQIVKL